MVAAPVLQRAGTHDVEGRMVAVEETTRGLRVLLDELAIERLQPDQLPANMRINLRGKAKLEPGDRIAVRARLQPPMGPAMPGGFDYARQAWFERLGALGYAFGAPRIVEPAAGQAELGVARLRACDLAADHPVRSRGCRCGVGRLADRRARRHHRTRCGAISRFPASPTSCRYPACTWCWWRPWSCRPLRYALALVPPLALRLPVKKIAAARRHRSSPASTWCWPAAACRCSARS